MKRWSLAVVALLALAYLATVPTPARADLTDEEKMILKQLQDDLKEAEIIQEIIDDEQAVLLSNQALLAALLQLAMDWNSPTLQDFIQGLIDANEAAIQLNCLYADINDGWFEYLEGAIAELQAKAGACPCPCPCPPGG